MRFLSRGFQSSYKLEENPIALRYTPSNVLVVLTTSGSILKFTSPSTSIPYFPLNPPPTDSPSGTLANLSSSSGAWIPSDRVVRLRSLEYSQDDSSRDSCFSFPMIVNSVTFSSAGRWLSVGCIDGSIHVFDALSHQLHRVFQTPSR